MLNPNGLQWSAAAYNAAAYIPAGAEVGGTSTPSICSRDRKHPPSGAPARWKAIPAGSGLVMELPGAKGCGDVAFGGGSLLDHPYDLVRGGGRRLRSATGRPARPPHETREAPLPHRLAQGRLGGRPKSFDLSSITAGRTSKTWPIGSAGSCRVCRATILAWGTEKGVVIIPEGPSPRENRRNRARPTRGTSSRLSWIENVGARPAMSNLSGSIRRTEGNPSRPTRVEGGDGNSPGNAPTFHRAREPARS